MANQHQHALPADLLAILQGLQAQGGGHGQQNPLNKAIPSISRAARDESTSEKGDIKLVDENSYGMRRVIAKRIQFWDYVPPLTIFSDAHHRLAHDPHWTPIGNLSNRDLHHYYESLKRVDDYMSFQEVVQAIGYVRCVVIEGIKGGGGTDEDVKQTAKEFVFFLGDLSNRWTVANDLVLTLYARRRIDQLFDGLVSTKSIKVDLSSFDTILYKNCEIETKTLERVEQGQEGEGAGARTLLEYLINEVVKKKTTMLESEPIQVELSYLKAARANGHINHLPLPHAIQFPWPSTSYPSPEGMITYTGPQSSLATSHVRNGRYDPQSHRNIPSSARNFPNSRTPEQQPTSPSTTGDHPPHSPDFQSSAGDDHYLRLDHTRALENAFH